MDATILQDKFDNDIPSLYQSVKLIIYGVSKEKGERQRSNHY